MLPVEAQMTPAAPASSALATATAMPRSLKLPVGFDPLELEVQLDAEALAEPRASGSAASSPRRGVSAGVAAPTGSRSR